MFKKTQTVFVSSVILSIVLGANSDIQAEETYPIYAVKMKYCPPPSLAQYVGDKNEEGCVVNFHAFKVWATEDGQKPKIKLQLVQKPQTVFEKSYRYVPLVYSRGCPLTHFPPGEPGFYQMDHSLFLQEQLAQDREIIEENLEIVIEETWQVSKTNIEETRQLLGTQPSPIAANPSGVDVEKECERVF